MREDANRKVEDTLRAALAAHRRGESDLAAEMYAQVLATNPELASAWNLSGLLAQSCGDYREAVSRIDRAIELAPEAAQYRVNLGVILSEMGNGEAAIEAFRDAIRLNSNLPEAHYNLGNALMTAGAHGDAVRCFQEALALKADYPEALNNIGILLRQQDETEMAVEYFRRAAAKSPPYVPALSNLCATLSDLRRHDEAIDAGRQAVALDPESRDAQYNLGNAFSRANDPDSAISCYERIVLLSPEDADVWCNIGVAELSRNRPGQSIAALDRALALQPGMPDGRWNKALAHLMQGEFRTGWSLYEARFEAIPWLGRHRFPQPEWQGEPLEGRVILLHTEQGYGDTLQFVRFLPDVATRGGRIVLVCQPALKRLLGLLPGVEAVYAYGETLPDFDVHLPIMSLPRAIGLAKVPTPDIPYLVRPDVPFPLPDCGKDLSIGLVWRVSKVNPAGYIRSCPLENLRSLLSRVGARFFSLQVDADAPDLTLLSELGVHDLTRNLSDFHDTACFISQLDLVISVDTVVAHLAGALGVPVWTLLTYSGDWRWFLDRDDTPWYPGMKLYRQRNRGDWVELVERVGEDLDRLIAANAANK